MLFEDYYYDMNLYTVYIHTIYSMYRRMIENQIKIEQ
jgi:hypothetical protein